MLRRAVLPLLLAGSLAGAPVAAAQSADHGDRDRAAVEAGDDFGPQGEYRTEFFFEPPNVGPLELLVLFLLLS